MIMNDFLCDEERELSATEFLNIYTSEVNFYYVAFSSFQKRIIFKYFEKVSYYL